MTKKLVALALAAIMTANANVSAISKADFAQTVAEVQNFVTAAKEAGLTDEQTVEVLNAIAETPAPTLDGKNKKIVTYAIVGGVVVVLGTAGLWYCDKLPDFCYSTESLKLRADKKEADDKAAAEKKIADENAAAEKKIADEKAAAEKKLADEKTAAEKKVADKPAKEGDEKTESEEED